MALASLKKNRNEYFRLSVTLFTITFVVALLLSMVNFFTSTKIKQINQQKLEKAMSEVLPEAKSFENITDQLAGKLEGETPVLNVQLAKDAVGNTIGYCIEVAPKGYSAEIDMMVGLDADGKIVDTSIISISDTPGIGTQVQDQKFSNQFIDKQDTVLAVKGDANADNEVALISGATYSSIGFTNGVNAALSVYKTITGEGAQ